MDTLIQSIFIAAAIGFASGAVGTFVLLEHMALAGDALAHVALPGIALALLYGIDPFWGVISFLIAAATVVWFIRTKTKLPSEALIGILFTTSLAVGILTIPDHEIIESLFGEFPVLSWGAFLSVVVAGIALAVLLFARARAFIFLNASRELAKAYRIDARTELLLLVVFAAIVALGIKLVGTLLMGALTIIPALIARNIARSIKSYMVLSALIGSAMSVFGVWIANQYHFLPGPTIVLLGVGLFAVSLLAIRR